MEFLKDGSKKADSLERVMNEKCEKSIGSDQDSTEADRNYRQLVSTNPDFEEILEYLFLVDQKKYPLSYKVLQYYDIRKKERYMEEIDFTNCEGVVIGKYTGHTLKNGKPFGQGVLTYNNEEKSWDGYFFNGMMHGDGYLYKNGSGEAIPLRMVNNEEDPLSNELQDNIKLLKEYVKNVDTRILPVRRNIIERYFEVGEDRGSNYRTKSIFDDQEVVLMNYRGPTLDRIPHGEGSVDIEDGLRWEGNFLNGMMHGVGKLTQNGKQVGYQRRIYNEERLTMRVEQDGALIRYAVSIMKDIFDIKYDTKNRESTCKIR